MWTAGRHRSVILDAPERFLDLSCGQRAGIDQLYFSSTRIILGSCCGQRAGIDQLYSRSSCARRCRRLWTAGRHRSVILEARGRRKTRLLWTAGMHRSVILLTPTEAEPSVVDSGQASISYTALPGVALYTLVVDSGQASLSYTRAQARLADECGCGQRAGVTQLYWSVRRHQRAGELWTAGRRHSVILPPRTWRRPPQLWTAGRRHSVILERLRHGSRHSCGQRAGVTQLYFSRRLIRTSASVVDSGQASLSYTGPVHLEAAGAVVDSGQASLSYTPPQRRGPRHSVVDSGQASLSYTLTGDG